MSIVAVDRGPVAVWVSAAATFLAVFVLPDRDGWCLVTFQDPDFDPGFATDLPCDGRHAIELSVFSENADTVNASLTAEARHDQDDPTLRLT